MKEVRLVTSMSATSTSSTAIDATPIAARETLLSSISGASAASSGEATIASASVRRTLTSHADLKAEVGSRACAAAFSFSSSKCRSSRCLRSRLPCLSAIAPSLSSSKRSCSPSWSKKRPPWSSGAAISSSEAGARFDFPAPPAHRSPGTLESILKGLTGPSSSSEEDSSCQPESRSRKVWPFPFPPAPCWISKPLAIGLRRLVSPASGFAMSRRARRCVQANHELAVPGGVLCRDAASNVVGAVGVSGASADEDEHCAILAAQAVGLTTEPAASALF
mmetsp:Transcript_36894/g.91850  ORF Transcript_36894/g.91850 Transcript_36894/m.91850 type:complete len:278 (+) Transcript_36894:1786-2619(+)